MIDRVRERDAFVRLRRDGVRVRADSLWCSFVHAPEISPPQVAFAIGRAVGTAVRRNRLRRRLRVLLAAAQLPPGLYLVGVRPHSDRRLGQNEHTFAELRRSVALLERQLAEHTSTPPVVT